MVQEEEAKLHREREEFFKGLNNAYELDSVELCKKLEVDPTQGLDLQEVEVRKVKYGPNELPKEEGTPLWKLVLKQFQDTLVLILILAAVVSFILAFFEEGEEVTTAFVEPLVIVLILLANATVGVLQESSAEAAVDALKAYESENAAVIRNGNINSIDSVDLVPGDIVELEVGNLIPADIRVLQVDSSTMDVAQEILTGESANVEKVAKKLVFPPGTAVQLQDRKNTLFSGTTITRGKCRGIVIGTGKYTEKGKIADSLKTESEEKIPLKEKLDEFGELLSKIIGVICVAVWVINIKHFNDPVFGSWFRGAIYYFKIAVSLAVAAIPEGLPAVVTTCLALGTQRMAKRNAIVTVLPAVETLGCTNVICSDKTGTLTTNQMSVMKFFVIGAQKNIVEFDVEGNTYAPAKPDNSAFHITNCHTNEKLVDPSAQSTSLKYLARICSVCNDSSIVYKEEANVYEKVGQSTEAAMKVLVEKLGIPVASEDAKLSGLSRADRTMACNKYWSSLYDKKYTLEFDRDRKSMSVFVQAKDGQKPALLVKGAWDNVLSRCSRITLDNGDTVPFDEKLKEAVTKKAEEYCTGINSFRCLALAQLEGSDIKFDLAKLRESKPESFADFEANLVFVGLVGILDPPREQVKDAIIVCKRAGIDVIMITGDNKSTATAICKKIGLIGEHENVEGKAFTGAEFKAMTREQKLESVKHAKLFARVEPLDKQELVKCLHAHKKVIAMTGDGVNDAPALKEADIGIAMGTGTAVAKGAAKMVLADDNFATIVAAVEEGRSIYNNTKQFIRYLICSNIGEVVAIFVTAISGLPEVLLPVQLLWVNLVTDGLPAVALGFNQAEPGIMLLPPRPRNEAIVTGFTLFRYLIIGTYIGLATVAGSIWWYHYWSKGPQLSWGQLFEWASCTHESAAKEGFSCEVFEDKNPNTISLSILVTIEMFCALNSLSEKQSLFSAGGNPSTNYFLLAAMSLSFGLHFVILYVPFLSRLFSVEPISWEEWQFVILAAFPVILIDEVLKFYDRVRTFGFGNSKEKAE